MEARLKEDILSEAERYFPWCYSVFVTTLSCGIHGCFYSLLSILF